MYLLMGVVTTVLFLTPLVEEAGHLPHTAALSIDGEKIEERSIQRRGQCG